MTADKVIVRFIKSHTEGALFNAGEIAGFEPDIARDLVSKGIAILHDSGLGEGVPLPSTPAAPEP